MRFSLLAIVTAAIATSAALCSPVEPRADAKVGYLFLHFYDNYKSPGDYSTYPAGEQVFGHLSKGNDPISYTALKGGAPLLTSTVGTKGVRDFYLVSKPDESQHYLIATDLNQTAANPPGFGGKFLSRNLVVWKSNGASLTKWSAPKLVNVVPNNFRMAWAPEAIWDDARKQFFVFWSSNKYVDSAHSGDPDSDKIYGAYTSDFTTFSAPFIYNDPGHGVIDMTLGRGPVDGKDTWVRFSKDESVSKCHGEISQNGYLGNWTAIGAAGQYVDNVNQSEACLYFQDNNDAKWWVFLDQYGRSPPGYFPWAVNTDITQYGYTDTGHPSGMPTLLKHGTVKPLTQAQYNEVKANWG